MKALALLLVVALSAPALADEPVLTPRVVVLSEAEAIAAAKRTATCEGKLQVYEARPTVPVAVAIAVVAGIVGAAAGVGVTYAVMRPK